MGMVMKLWLVCFLLLFFAVEGWQWLGHALWFQQVDLSLPLVVTGGMALAIASNTWRRPTPHRSPEPQEEPPALLPAPKTPLGASSTGVPQSQLTPSSPSISFAIRKPQRQERKPSGH